MDAIGRWHISTHDVEDATKIYIISWHSHCTVKNGSHHTTLATQGAVLDRRPVPAVCLAKTKKANRTNVYPRTGGRLWCCLVGMVLLIALKKCPWPIKLMAIPCSTSLMQDLFASWGNWVLWQERSAETLEGTGQWQILRWTSSLNCKVCQHCGKHMTECSLLSCCVKWGLQLMVTALFDDWGVRKLNQQASYYCAGMPPANASLLHCYLRPAARWRRSCPSLFPFLWLLANNEAEGS